jgi:hypothetical protein
MAISVLSAFTDAKGLFPEPQSAQDFLLQQISAVAQKRISDQQKTIDQTATDQAARVRSEGDKFVTVRSHIYSAQAAVDVGKKNVGTIKSMLLGLRTTISKAAARTPDTKATRTEFNSKIMLINQLTTSARPGTSLIGSLDKLNYMPDRIEYLNDGRLGITTLQGVYSGGGYRIEADDGTLWVPDLATDSIGQYRAQGGNKTKYTLSDGTEVDTVTSTRNGMKLKAYDPITNAISIEITIDAEQAPIIVNGTLKRSGIKLMQSWFYEGLETDDGRKRAHSDLSRAEVQLTFTDIALTRANTTTTADAQKLDAKLKEFATKSGSIKLEQMAATQKLQNEQQRQLQAMVLRYGTATKMQQNYKDYFSSFVSNPFIDFLT